MISKFSSDTNARAQRHSVMQDSPLGRRFVFVLEPNCSIRVTSSLWCSPPNMSSVTEDHDDV
ncbi:MAG TPA: hypothetical protein VN982_14910, partial [Candidatus Dormibacteraeota bacterium]|nr:hypothetical protein [Candidatus Dormibacteraeota bacterium]